MSITPIEIASMTPKSAEVSATRQGEVARTMHNQASLNAQFNNDIKQNSLQTVKTSEADNPEYRYDAKNKGNNSYQEQQKKNKKRKEERNFTGENIKKNGFDVRI